MLGHFLVAIRSGSAQIAAVRLDDTAGIAIADSAEADGMRDLHLIQADPAEFEPFDLALTARLLEAPSEAPKPPTRLPRSLNPPHLRRLSRWARLDSNQGPTDYESAALTS